MKTRFGYIQFLSSLILLMMTACNILPASPEDESADEDFLIPVTGAESSPTFVETVVVIPLVQHLVVPGELPAERVNHAGDHDASQTADQRRVNNGDRFSLGRYERPFNSDPMDVYFPHLDIQDTQYFRDDTWIYALITLKGPDGEGGLSGRYAFEIDSDLDGRGDWLILVAQPASSEWSTAGVQVWADGNEDVGGANSMNADLQPDGNGYDTLLFDQDAGEDPDLAWARVDPTDPNSVQLAVKRSLMGTDDSFMVGAWAGNSDLDPARFDLNDRMTHDQAGAALKEFEFFYPIKELSELDNACRVPVGFELTSVVPGLCPIAPEQVESSGCVNLYCYPIGAAPVCFCLDP